MTTARSIKMPAQFTLEPTRQDALTGVCNSPRKCMYAKNTWRLFPGATYVGVNPNGVTITLNGFYYHYAVPKRAVACMAVYDKNGKFITDADLKKARVTVHLSDVKPCSYNSTEEVKARHRQNSAKRRSDPNYVRPDSKNTLRAQLARSRQGVKHVDGNAEARA
jgi:hypothetical protein